MKIVHRTLDCFEKFAQAGQPMTLTELARALDVPISSCFSLIQALRSRGYLYSLGGRRGLYPTRRMLDVVELIAARDPVTDMFTPALEALRDATGETVVLGKRQEDKVIYLIVIEGLQTIRFSAKVGDTAWLHTSAIGKAVLANLGDDELRETIAQLSLEKRTRASITHPKRLFQHLRDASEAGYFSTRGENVDDVMAVSAAVLVGDEPFAIAIAGPIVRMEQACAHHVQKLLATCERIKASFSLAESAPVD